MVQSTLPNLVTALQIYGMMITNAAIAILEKVCFQNVLNNFVSKLEKLIFTKTVLQNINS